MSQWPTCQDGYTWMYNSQSQNPCEVYSRLSALCTDGNQWLVVPLNKTIPHYQPPPESFASPCQCNSVAWSLVEACATCQNGGLIDWGSWTQFCPSTYVSKTFPYDTSSTVIVPTWAQLDVPVDGVWNATAADAFAESPQSTETTIGSSSSLAPTSTQTSPESAKTSEIPPKTSSQNKGKLAGELIGAMLGGMVLTGLIFFIWYQKRRNRQRPESEMNLQDPNPMMREEDEPQGRYHWSPAEPSARLNLD